MFRKVFSITSFLILLLFFSSFHTPSDTNTKRIVDQMFVSIDNIKTLKFKLRKKERIKDKIIPGEQDCKFFRSPKKIYTKIVSPNEGVEILYLQGKNDNKALVYPNGFPYFSVNLSPYSSSMRNNNHHTIHEVGFDYINGIVSNIAKSPDNFNKYFRYEGDTVVNGRKCSKIVIDYTDFKYLNYTVRKGETVTDIAYRLFISDYMILQLNKNISDYTSVSEGDIIKIPNVYARITNLYIDKENHLPILQVMYDEKGLFSMYEFINLQVNPPIPEEEFTRSYKGYKF